MEEVEKKSRVTMMNQQLMFRGKYFLLERKKKERFFFFYQGQRLHQTPSKELEKFGLFNGNHITLIGKKVCS